MVRLAGLLVVCSGLAGPAAAQDLRTVTSLHCVFGPSASARWEGTKPLVTTSAEVSGSVYVTINPARHEAMWVGDGEAMDMDVSFTPLGALRLRDSTGTETTLVTDSVAMLIKAVQITLHAEAGEFGSPTRADAAIRLGTCRGQ